MGAVAPKTNKQIEMKAINDVHIKLRLIKKVSNYKFHPSETHQNIILVINQLNAHILVL